MKIEVAVRLRRAPAPPVEPGSRLHCCRNPVAALLSRPALCGASAKQQPRRWRRLPIDNLVARCCELPRWSAPRVQPRAASFVHTVAPLSLVVESCFQSCIQFGRPPTHRGILRLLGISAVLMKSWARSVLSVQSAVGTSGRVPSAGECRSEQLSTFNFTSKWNGP